VADKHTTLEDVARSARVTAIAPPNTVTATGASSERRTDCDSVLLVDLARLPGAVDEAVWRQQSSGWDHR
jgi:hypothetical protein